MDINLIQHVYLKMILYPLIFLDQTNNQLVRGVSLVQTSSCNFDRISDSIGSGNQLYYSLYDFGVYEDFVSGRDFELSPNNMYCRFDQAHSCGVMSWYLDSI